MQINLDNAPLAGSWAWPGAGRGAGAAALLAPALMARFHSRMGASGRRYHFTRYDSRDDIADFTNIVMIALDAWKRPCSCVHIDHDGYIRQLSGTAHSDHKPIYWDIRFLPLDRAAGEAVIHDLTRHGDA